MLKIDNLCLFQTRYFESTNTYLLSAEIFWVYSIIKY